MAVAAIKGEKTLIEPAQECDVHPNPNKQWRDQLLDRATGVFGEAAKAAAEQVYRRQSPACDDERANAGERLFVRRDRQGRCVTERKKMITHGAKLSTSRQAKVLGISRGSVYYKRRPVSESDLKRVHRSDKLHMAFPVAGSRMLRALRVQEGVRSGGCTVATLMKPMGITALYRWPNTSKPAPGHKVYPYLSRKLPITRPNQVWTMDITYIPIACDFIYLAAVLDWFTRRAFAWRASITPETAFCIEAVEG